MKIDPNYLFGAISKKSAFVNASEKNFNDYLKTIDVNRKLDKLVSSNTIKILYSSNTNKLIGVAESKDKSLLLYGYLYAPLPECGGEASLIGEPDKSAEYLLERYNKLGKRFLDDIYGHYSVVVYDHKSGSIVVARDTGMNEIFYHQSKDGLVFASKPRIVAESIKDSLQINRGREDFFLIHGFYPFNETPYEDIMLLPPSSMMTVENSKLEISKINYSQLPGLGGLEGELSLINGLHAKLRQATKDLLPSKKEKVAVLLGGFDSALVASLLKNEGFEVETFSFYYNDDKYNQAHTDTVANFLNIKHNWIQIDEKVIEQGLNNFSHIFNQPTNWPSYVIQTAFLCDEIQRRGFKYCYTGDGCDALFYGYPITFKRANFLGKIGKMPNGILKRAIKLMEIPVLERVVGRPYQVAIGALRSAQRNESTRTFLTFRVFDDMSLKQLRLGKQPTQTQPVEETIEELSTPRKGTSAVRLAYEGKGMVSPNRNKINGSADASGLVIASPYMHFLVKSYAQAIPDNMLRPKDANVDIGKYLLSKMAESKNLLPPEVIYQPKIGAADSPIEQWYESSLGKVVAKKLQGLPFNYGKRYVDSLIKTTVFERAYEKYMSRGTNHIFTMSHAISLLTTYASFTEAAKKQKKS